MAVLPRRLVLEPMACDGGSRASSRPSLENPPLEIRCQRNIGCRTAVMMHRHRISFLSDTGFPSRPAAQGRRSGRNGGHQEGAGLAVVQASADDLAVIVDGAGRREPQPVPEASSSDWSSNTPPSRQMTRRLGPTSQVPGTLAALQPRTWPRLLIAVAVP